MRRIGLRGDPRLVDLLDWPRRKNPKLRKGFTRYLTKGGSLPGIVTEASYIRPRGRSGVGVALFLRDLPPAVEAALQRTFVQQQLIARLAADPTFRDRARRVLARG